MSRSDFKNNKGAIFITTMIVILLIIMISSFMFYMISQDVFMARYIRDSSEAELIAEAGLNTAIATVATSFSNKNNAALFPLTTFGDGTYDVTVVQSGGRVLLSSAGVVRGVTRVVSAEVENLTSPSLNYAISSGININASGKIDITGGIHSNQNANLNGGPMVIHDDGALSAVKFVHITGDVTYGSITESAPEVSIVTPNFTYYKNLAQTGGKYYSGNLNLSGSGAIASGTNGIVYVNNVANISGNYTLNGCLIAKNINISGTITQTKVGEYPAFMSSQNLSISGNINAHGLMYAGQNGNINANGTIIGILTAASNNINLSSSGGLNVIFESENPPDLPAAVFRIVSWNR